ncbi:hypothetical protein ABZT06_20780 [Streptomyces sp. NPDC005483]|uniref:hypothetical protein n=1 Tax=Streptomyces sp. NPDC005483 TaxID=3154882 RepID=UPI0033B0EF01
MDHQALTPFLASALAEYSFITPEQPLPCFAVLLGRLEDDTAYVERSAFGRNSRATDPSAQLEFSEAIVPRFGRAYENEHRGWWIDSHDVLRITRAAEEDGLDVLGSIHMHPDWHRIGPPEERGARLSERPTPMDTHVFAGTAWPVNVICYLEQQGEAMYHALAAWGPPQADAPEVGCTELELRIRADAGAAASAKR